MMLSADTPLDPPNRRTVAVLGTLASVALGVSVYLSILAYTDASPSVGCGGGAALDCSHALHSKWARVMGAPVSVLGAIAYAGVLGMLRLSFASSHSWRVRAWWTLMLLAVSIAGAGLWFTGLQMSVVEKLCPFCLVVHLCGMIIAATIFFHTPITYRWPRRTRAAVRITATGKTEPGKKRPLAATPGVYLQHLATALLGGLVLLAGLVTVQSLSPHTSYKVLAFNGSKPSDSASTDSQIAGSERGDSGEAGSDASGELELSELDELFPETIRDFQLSAMQDDPAKVVERFSQPAESAEKPPGAAPPPVRKPQVVDQQVVILDGSVTLPLAKHMLVGPGDAKYVVVKMFDYTCSYCRILHYQLDEVVRQYDGKLAVVLLPVPLNAGCNPALQGTLDRHTYACLYARLAAAVWLEDRVAFDTFHRWLFEPLNPPDPGRARAEAARLIGVQKLEARLMESDVEKHIAQGVEIFKKCEAGALPKLIMGGAILTGELKDDAELRRVLEEHGVRAE